MYGIIYKITNKINNKVYIGQVVAKKGLAKRWKRHVDTAKSGANYLISIAIRKYGEDNFTIEEIDTADSREELNEKEIYWISYYQSFTDRNKGYNMTSGGDGGNTYSRRSEQDMLETRRKLSIRMKTNNPNHGQYVGKLNSMYGKHHTEETKELMRSKLKGRKKPKDHGKHVSEAIKGKCKNYIPAIVILQVRDLEGNIVDELSAKKIVEKYNICDFKTLKQLVDNKTIIDNKFIISKRVSTIPDECKGVGSEISTDSKRKTTEK